MKLGKSLLRVHVFLSRRLTYIYGSFLVVTPLAGLYYAYGYYFRGVRDFTQLIHMYWLAILAGVVIQVLLWLGLHPKRNGK